MMLLRSEALIGAIYLWMPIDDPGPQQCDPVDSAYPHQQAAARHAGSEAGVPRQPNTPAVRRAGGAARHATMHRMHRCRDRHARSSRFEAC
jgi:hypothetical protein